jgi:hypothetical protein
MALFEQVQQELARKRSNRAYLSAGLNQILVAGVLREMGRQALDFSTCARLIGIDPSSHRKWLLGLRPRIRSEPGELQTVSLRKGLVIAKWLDNQQRDPQPNPQSHDPQDLIVLIRAKALAHGISLHPTKLSGATSIPATLWGRIFSGEALSQEDLTPVLAWIAAE